MTRSGMVEGLLPRTHRLWIGPSTTRPCRAVPLPVPGRSFPVLPRPRLSGRASLRWSGPAT